MYGWEELVPAEFQQSRAIGTWAQNGNLAAPSQRSPARGPPAVSFGTLTRAWESRHTDVGEAGAHAAQFLGTFCPHFHSGEAERSALEFSKGKSGSRAAPSRGSLPACLPARRPRSETRGCARALT